MQQQKIMVYILSTPAGDDDHDDADIMGEMWDLGWVHCIFISSKQGYHNIIRVRRRRKSVLKCFMASVIILEQW